MMRGGGRMATAAGPSCGPSAPGVKPPSVLRPGCCCYMQEIAPVDYWHQAHSSSLGGPRHFGTGPGLTIVKRFGCTTIHKALYKMHRSFIHSWWCVGSILELLFWSWLYLKSPVTTNAASGCMVSCSLIFPYSSLSAWSVLAWGGM